MVTDSVVNQQLAMQKLYEPKYENEHQVVFLSKAPSITFRNQESFLPKIFIKI